MKVLELQHALTVGGYRMESLPNPREDLFDVIRQVARMDKLSELTSY
jgi:hypothetical protein